MQADAMEKVQDFPVSPEELWQAVSEADQLAAWLGDAVELDVRPGGHGTVVDDGELRRVVIDDVEDGRRLSFTWWPERHDEPRHGHALAGVPTQVELEVIPVDGGSRLIVRETAPTAGRWGLRMALMAFSVDARCRL
jgi:uncharacterized protein YndB with AHSA1/START domain